MGWLGSALLSLLSSWDFLGWVSKTPTLYDTFCGCVKTSFYKVPIIFD